MGLVTKLQARVTAALSRTTGNVSPAANLDYQWVKNLASGNGTNQANCVYQEQFSINSGGTQVVDLNGLPNDLGQVQTFTAVKGILVTAAASNPGPVTLTSNGVEGFADWLIAAGDGVSIPAGGCFMIANPEGAGWASVDNTDDKLLLSYPAGGGAAVVNVIIVGAGTVT